MEIQNVTQLTQIDIDHFLDTINFKLPEGYLDFLVLGNGAEIYFKNSFLQLWPLNNLISLNEEYGTPKFAPEFIIFGSDGGDIAYAIEKRTGHIFEMPFIGMSNDEAKYICNNFIDFISILNHTCPK